DEAAGFPLRVQAAVEVVGAELVVGGAGGQDVPDDDQDGVGDDDDGLVLGGAAAVPAGLHDVPAAEGPEVALVPGRRPGGLGEDGPGVLVAVAALAGVLLAGRLVVAWADPGPGGQVGGAGEEGPDVRADLGDDRGGGQLPDAGDGGQQVL